MSLMYRQGALQRSCLRNMTGRAVAPRPVGCRALQTDTKADEYTNGGPAPQKFTPAAGQMMPLAAASLNMVLRLGSGALCQGYKAEFVEDDGKYSVASVSGRRLSETSQVAQFRRPAKTLELYEFEGCPFCKKVREAFVILDLDVIVYPCPQNGATWRPKANALGGKKQFPLLVDPNSDRIMYESDDIIAYLCKEYGDGTVPLSLRLGMLTTISCALALAPRSGHGGPYKGSRLPEQPLILWQYEASPFCKVVREVMCELELPYLQRTTGRGSPKRQELLDKRGTFQVPYLEDPNTKQYMFESAAIIDYLRRTYGTVMA